MYLDKHIENWVMIIDVEKKGLLNFPWKAVKSMVDTTNLSFSSRLHKMFIVNPSFIFNTTWNMIKGLIDPETVRKFSFLKRKDFGLFQEVIPKDQLLKEYGGDLEQPVTAFPIRNTLKPDVIPRISEEEANVNNFIIENTYKELTTSKKSYAKNFRLIDIHDDAENLALETRSLQVMMNESQLSKEMTRISAYSYSRG